jgi:hypothetical protein
MEKPFLILLMSSLGIALALNPVTSVINPNLLKGTTWLFEGIVYKFLK